MKYWLVTIALNLLINFFRTIKSQSSPFNFLSFTSLLKAFCRNRLNKSWHYNKVITFEQMHPPTPQKWLIPQLAADLQLNYTGHFLISVPTGSSQSRKYIQNNKHRNWSEEQRHKFAAFLHYHHQKIATIDNRKVNKIFKVLSQYMQTRNINQCRTFAFKMISKFGSVQRLNQFFEESLPEYTEIVRRQRSVLEGLASCGDEKIRDEEMERDKTKKMERSSLESEIMVRKCGKEEDLKPTDTQYPLQSSKEGKPLNEQVEGNKMAVNSANRIGQAMGFFRSPSFLDTPELYHKGQLNSCMPTRKTQSASTDFQSCNEPHTASSKPQPLPFQF